jgi:hypothetical protein
MTDYRFTNEDVPCKACGREDWIKATHIPTGTYAGVYCAECYAAHRFLSPSVNPPTAQVGRNLLRNAR